MLKSHLFLPFFCKFTHYFFYLIVGKRRRWLLHFFAAYLRTGPTSPLRLPCIKYKQWSNAFSTKEIGRSVDPSFEIMIFIRARGAMMRFRPRPTHFNKIQLTVEFRMKYKLTARTSLYCLWSTVRFNIRNLRWNLNWNLKQKPVAYTILNVHTNVRALRLVRYMACRP